MTAVPAAEDTQVTGPFGTGLGADQTHPEAPCPLPNCQDRPSLMAGVLPSVVQATEAVVVWTWIARKVRERGGDEAHHGVSQPAVGRTTKTTTPSVFKMMQPSG